MDDETALATINKLAPLPPFSMETLDETRRIEAMREAWWVLIDQMVEAEGVDTRDRSLFGGPAYAK